ncbi:MAG: rubrerythrin family protein [archaeon]
MEETLKNLGKAFIGECQARNRYTYYSKQALKDNYPQLSDIFALTADQEKEHAKQLLLMIQDVRERAKKAGIKLPEENIVEAKAETFFGDTKSNLAAAIAGEHYENISMYPTFAQIAEKEGLVDIAGRLKSIAVAEKHHEERYLKFIEGIEKGTLWKKDKVITWTCRECGYVHVGKEPPKVCPACKHDYWFYQVKCEEY